MLSFPAKKKSPDFGLTWKNHDVDYFHPHIKANDVIHFSVKKMSILGWHLHLAKLTNFDLRLHSRARSARNKNWMQTVSNSVRSISRYCLLKNQASECHLRFSNVWNKNQSLIQVQRALCSILQDKAISWMFSFYIEIEFVKKE